MKLLLTLLFYIVASGWVWGDSLASKNREGNSLYKNGDINGALSKWRDAQIENPDSDKLYYNIGNGLHAQKKYEGALNEYEKSLDSKDSELRSKAYYNMGNTHYRMSRLPEAIEDYKKCLEINPKDEDAKYNIEFIKKKLKENQQKKEQQQGGNSGGKQEKQDQASQSEEEQQKDKEPSEAQKPEEGSERQEKENQALEKKQQAGQEEKKEEKSLSEEREKGEMSKEDAVRLLDALKDDEKDVQKELRNKPVEGRYRADKDW